MATRYYDVIFSGGPYGGGSNTGHNLAEVEALIQGISMSPGNLQFVGLSQLTDTGVKPVTLAEIQAQDLADAAAATAAGPFIPPVQIPTSGVQTISSGSTAGGTAASGAASTLSSYFAPANNDILTPTGTAIFGTTTATDLLGYAVFGLLVWLLWKFLL